MHLVLSSLAAPNQYEVNGVGVQMALDLVHRVKKTDLLTGLSTRTQGGRPDFDKVSEGGGGGAVRESGRWKGEKERQTETGKDRGDRQEETRREWGETDKDSERKDGDMQTETGKDKERERVEGDRQRHGDTGRDSERGEGGGQTEIGRDRDGDRQIETGR